MNKRAYLELMELGIGKQADFKTSQQVSKVDMKKPDPAGMAVKDNKNVRKIKLSQLVKKAVAGKDAEPAAGKQEIQNLPVSGNLPLLQAAAGGYLGWKYGPKAFDKLMDQLKAHPNITKSIVAKYVRDAANSKWNPKVMSYEPGKGYAYYRPGSDLNYSDAIGSSTSPHQVFKTLKGRTQQLEKNLPGRIVNGYSRKWMHDVNNTARKNLAGLRGKLRLGAGLGSAALLAFLGSRLPLWRGEVNFKDWIKKNQG